MYTKKLAIIPMRCQVFTEGHANLVTKALEMAESVLIVLGSANVASDIKNPFTVYQRHDMLAAWLEQEKIPLNRVSVEYLDDDPCEDKWKEMFFNIVRGYTFNKRWFLDQVVMLGSSKDDDISDRNSWLDVPTEHIEPYNVEGFVVSATDIRKLIFTGEVDNLEKSLEKLVIENFIPKSTKDYLVDYISTEFQSLKRLRAEYESIQDCKKKYGKVISHTGDILPVHWKEITVKGVSIKIPHVLLVKRGGKVGNGLYALAGGFMEDGETFLQAGIREAQEELNINLQGKKFIKSVTKSETDRDPRGRVITQAFRFDVDNKFLKQSEIIAGDDACEFVWLTLDELRVNNTFLDHYYIIQELLS